MHHFHYVNGELYAEDVPLRRVADEAGTPLFVYSRETLKRHFTVFREPFESIDHLICFSMKACSNMTVLRLFANMGGGVDIVSGGELYRALKAGVPAERIVYSGVGKKASEMDEALAANILMFNVESEEELHLLDERAVGMGSKARIAIRVNPDVDPRTHPYISTGLKKNKFGIDSNYAITMYRAAKEMPGIDPVGVDCHIGSQLTELEPFLEAVDRIKELVARLREDGVDVRYLDIGGGLGIPYEDEEPPAPAEYGEAIVKSVRDMGVKLILEPGRVLTGNAGVLVTRVLFRKRGAMKNFIIADAAMNDLIRPSLYQAYHAILPIAQSSDAAPTGRITADVVGPICETGDFLALDREIDDVQPGELLAVMSAGAYAFSMASTYNSRPRAAEVLVIGDDYYVIRERESYEDLIRGEHIPPVIMSRPN